MRSLLLAGCACFLMLGGCSTDFEVNAPAEPLFAVYCVLDPQSAEQYVRVSYLFQTEEDATQVLADSDLSVKNLNIRLISSAKTWLAESYVGGDGKTHYRFLTAGADTLEPGLTYRLEIYRPRDKEPFVFATTQIPLKPEILGYEGPVLLPSGYWTYPTVEFAEDQPLIFKTGQGKGFEARILLYYQMNGTADTLRFGPLKTFIRSSGCGQHSVTENEVCYLFPAKQFLHFLQSRVQKFGSGFRYSDIPLQSPDSSLLRPACTIEATSLDSCLTRFLVGADPFGFGVNMLLDKADYSNMNGSHVGIFGARHSCSRKVNLSSCSKYLSGLVIPVSPPVNCSWQ